MKCWNCGRSEFRPMLRPTVSKPFREVLCCCKCYAEVHHDDTNSRRNWRAYINTSGAYEGGDDVVVCSQCLKEDPSLEQDIYSSTSEPCLKHQLDRSADSSSR